MHVVLIEWFWMEPLNAILLHYIPVWCAPVLAVSPWLEEELPILCQKIFNMNVSEEVYAGNDLCVCIIFHSNWPL